MSRPSSMAMPQCGWRAVSSPASVTMALEPPEVGEERRPVAVAHVERRVVPAWCDDGPRTSTSTRWRRAGARRGSRSRARHRSGRGGRGGPARSRRRCSGRDSRRSPGARQGRSAGSRRARAPWRCRPLSTISRRTRSRSHQVAPAGGFVHAPGDRRARHSFEQIAHDSAPDPPDPMPARVGRVDGQSIVLVRCCAIGCTGRGGRAGMPGPGVELIGEEEIAEVMRGPHQSLPEPVRQRRRPGIRRQGPSRRAGDRGARRRPVRPRPQRRRFEWPLAGAARPRCRTRR